MTGDVDVFGQIDTSTSGTTSGSSRSCSASLHRRRRARARGVRDLSHGRRSTHRCSSPRRWRCSSRRAAACSSTARSASAATAARCSRRARRACSASIATPTRSRWRPPTLAPFGDRVELVHADYRDLDAACSTRAASRASPARSPISACRRCSSTPRAAGSAFSATSRSTCGWTGRGRRRPPTCWRDVDEEELANVIFQYGEERYSRRIARAIVAGAATSRRSRRPGSSRASSGARFRVRGHQRIDPATRTFQALRIWVNRELDGLDAFLGDAVAAAARRRPAGGHRVSLARGPHREAHVPRARARRDGASGC